MLQQIHTYVRTQMTRHANESLEICRKLNQFKLIYEKKRTLIIYWRAQQYRNANKRKSEIKQKMHSTVKNGFTT